MRVAPSQGMDSRSIAIFLAVNTFDSFTVGRASTHTLLCLSPILLLDFYFYLRPYSTRWYKALLLLIIIILVISTGNDSGITLHYIFYQMSTFHYSPRRKFGRKYERRRNKEGKKEKRTIIIGTRVRILVIFIIIVLTRFQFSLLPCFWLLISFFPFLFFSSSLLFLLFSILSCYHKDRGDKGKRERTTNVHRRN
jgi:hypothetical protein